MFAYVRLGHFFLIMLPVLGYGQEPASRSVPPTIARATPQQLTSMAQFLQRDALKEEVRALAKILAADAAFQASPHQALRLQTLLGQDGPALQTLREMRQPGENPHEWMHYVLFLNARLKNKDAASWDQRLAEAFEASFAEFDQRTLVLASQFTGYSLSQGESQLKRMFQRLKTQATLDQQAAMNLIIYLQDYWVYGQLLPQAQGLVDAAQAKHFTINDQVIIHTKDGAELSATLVIPKDFSTPQPTLLQFNIYTHPQRNRLQAVDMASRGYVAMIADARGKRLSSDTIRPYETEVGDVNAVIDWICKQPWSDGRVGMFGGSYLGFAQWAATKDLHPGLKTIVPSAAAIPGLGLPMENNIFLNANYGWAFHVTNNRTIDPTIYQNPARWDQLNQAFYQQGIAYRRIDSLDQKPNPWLQRWLKHPAYDAYWQAMVPFREDFAKIDIPILSFTGYYDDGQISAIHYVAEHYRFRSNPEHYLVIGPYDHFTTQTKPNKTLRGYQLDPSAHINITELTYAWLDHILKDKPKPSILKDKVNYQVMGADRWQHAPSLQALHGNKQRLYLSKQKGPKISQTSSFRLSSQPPSKASHATQQIDLTDRSQQFNDYYPWPIVKKDLTIPNGLVYVSEPLAEDRVLAGRFSGALTITLNKQDADLGLVLYAWLPDDTFFHLSYWLGRTSFAQDMTKRQLLTPGTATVIPIARTRMVARLLPKGTRLVVLANVNMNPFAQVNYGSGKDVSDETMADAGEPLRIQWHTTSYVEIPMTPTKP